MNELFKALITLFNPDKPIEGSMVDYPWYEGRNGKIVVHNTDGTVSEVGQVPQGAVYYPEATPTPAPMKNDFSYYTRGQVPQDLSSLITQTANQIGINPSLLAAMLFQESGINPNSRDNPNIDKTTGKVLSRDRGIAQINSLAHPEVTDQMARDVNFAIPFMAKELSGAYKLKGSWPQAIASYNVGRGRTGYDSSRDQYGLGPLGRNYVTGVRANLDPTYATQIGLPNYEQAQQ